MPERKQMPCPFCGEDIECLFYPRLLVTHYARAASNKKAMNYYKDERWIPTANCSHCAASVAEIKNALSSTSLLASEAAKKAIASGLPTTF